MEVKIGVQNAPRELVLETDESRRRTSRSRSPTRVTERRHARPRPTCKGRRIVVPGDKLAYVEIGDGVTGQVGFRS